MQQHYPKYQQQRSRQQTTPSSPSSSSTPRSPPRFSRDGQPPTLVPAHIVETTYSSYSSSGPSSTSTVSPTTSSASFPSSSVSSTPSPPPTPSTTRRNNPILYCDSCQMAPPPLPLFDIVQYPVKDTLLIVSELLAQVVQKNDSQFNPLTDPITLFHSRAVPRISIEAYLARILQFIPFTNEVLLNVLVYLDRIGGLDGMELIEDETLFSQLCSPLTTAPVSSVSSTSRTIILADSQHSSSISGSSPTFVPPTIDRRVKPPCCHTCAVPLSLPIPTSTSTSTVSSSSSQSHINNSNNNTNNNTDTHSSTLIPSSESSPSCVSNSSSISSSSSSLSFSCAVAASTSTPSFPSSSLPRHGHDSLASTANRSSSNNTNNNNSDTIGPAILKRGRESVVIVEGGRNNDEESSHFVTSQQATNVIQPQDHPQHPQQHLHKECWDVSYQPATKKSRLTIHPVHVAIPVHAPSGKVAVSTSAITAAAVAASSMPSSTTSDPSSHPTPSSLPVTTLNGFKINSFNIHRLLITCLMVAAKFTSDLFYSNARYAKVGGLSLPELNQLELEFLFTTRFELNVKVDELQRVGNSLLRHKNQETRPIAQNLAPQMPQPQYQQPRVSTAAASATNATVNSVTTATTTIASTTSAQPTKSGRFSIPSPTSPRNGPMSDRPQSSSSSSSSSSLTPVAPVPESRPAANRGQLLSPPEEKRPWTDDVQATEE